MTPTAGRLIALAAILVQGPRLILALLAADRQPVAPDWQRALLVVAGLGTALVLTGGNLYLAHAVATAKRWRARLTVVWLLVLVSAGSLLVPMIAAGLSGRTLPEVLDSTELQWSWAALAAVAHELTAAGCMLASAALAPASPQVSPLSELGRLGERADSSLRAAESQAQPLAQPWSCREGCGRTFRSAAAAAGHLRHCPARLERRKALPSSLEVRVTGGTA
jgi:hypothetical protein